MARRIVEAGIPTTLWARRAATLEPFRDTPAEIADTPAELAARSDLVAICVFDDSGVDEVLHGDAGVLAGIQPGAVVVVHSTVHPDTVRRYAEEAAERGIELLDAPVSGGGAAAAAGRLVVMVGGTPEAFERCEAVLQTFGDPVVHVGPLGAGQLAKLVNNVMFAAHLRLASDAAGLARSFGLDPLQLARVVQAGSGASYSLGALAAIGGSITPIAERIGDVMHKDIGIVAEVARDAGVDTGVLMSVAQALNDLLDVERGTAVDGTVGP
jgi:3-hydroxyisobutyrate dehydrogenase-like beta-hydroxyacid dehydrogenase